MGTETKIPNVVLSICQPEAFMTDAEIAATRDTVLTECDLGPDCGCEACGTTDWPYADDETGRTVGGRLL